MHNRRAILWFTFVLAACSAPDDSRGGPGSAGSKPSSTPSPSPTSAPAPELTALTVSRGRLVPAFNPALTDYQIVDVPFFTNEVSINPLAAGQTVVTVTQTPTGFRVVASLPALGADRVYTITLARPPADFVKASNTSANARFGRAVALDGDTMAIAAPSESSVASSGGAVYVYTWNGDNWSQQALLQSPQPVQQGFFGNAVSISGDTLAIAAPGESLSPVYVFQRTAGAWALTATLVSPGASSGDTYESLSLHGDTLALGAPGREAVGPGILGAVDVYERTSTNGWSLTAQLTGSAVDGYDFFGRSVSVHGNDIAVGAPGDDVLTPGNPSGAAYVFVRDGNGWSEQFIIRSWIPTAEEAFGNVVSIDGDLLVIGAENSSRFATQAGAAYVTNRVNGLWYEHSVLGPQVSMPYLGFGRTVRISGNLIVIGATGDGSSSTGFNGPALPSVPGFEGSGAAYLFKASASSTTQIGFLKAQNPGQSDRFGIAVAISGTRVLVGADNESSSASGINGDPFNDDAFHSGAAYLFR